MNLAVFLFVSIALVPVPLRAEQTAEISPRILDSNRDLFAKLYREAYGDDRATYMSCTSMDQ